jgi:hypothetical protein
MTTEALRAQNKGTGAYFGHSESRFPWPSGYKPSSERPAPWSCSEAAPGGRAQAAICTPLTQRRGGRSAPGPARPGPARPGLARARAPQLRDAPAGSERSAPIGPAGARVDAAVPRVTRQLAGPRRRRPGKPAGSLVTGASTGLGGRRQGREEPRASSRSPLGPPCDFETGAPDRSLETATPPPSSRGRHRWRQHAAHDARTVLAGCRAVGGASSVRHRGRRAGGLCLRVVGSVSSF